MKKDNCVCCGKETPYDIDCHIDLRYYYIEGAGQLCRDCYERLYEKNNELTIKSFWLWL